MKKEAGSKEPRMGTRDSSKTRATPVFNFLFNRNETGRSWLPKLLELPNRGHPLFNARAEDGVTTRKTSILPLLFSLGHSATSQTLIRRTQF
jgi:hypothetical protein